MASIVDMQLFYRGLSLNRKVVADNKPDFSTEPISATAYVPESIVARPGARSLRGCGAAATLFSKLNGDRIKLTTRQTTEPVK